MRFFAIFAILVLFNSCSTSGSPSKKNNGAPKWMTNIEADFPNSKYLAAVGSGDSRRRAQEDASAFLAQQFTVNVKVDTVAQQKYAELVKEDKNYKESEIILNHTIGTQANEEFINLRFSDPYTDNSGTTHIVAYIEREPTAFIYRDIIRKDLAKAEEFYSRASSVTGSFKRYAFYDAAYAMGLNAERMIEQLRIIHMPSAAILGLDINNKKFAEARDKEAENLSYHISITGDKEGKVAAIIRDTMREQSISYNPNGKMAVKGTWSTSPVSLNPNFKSVIWTADISLFDETGTTIATFYKEARENGITEDQAETFVYREFQKQVSKDLRNSIQSYLTRIATGK
ncbi:MAG: LPP20 family lipoprotein [Spirochaetaceae bacterium]|nr:LPP20 family lipoprotein [Spirochaetaceae bacterium]